MIRPRYFQHLDSAAQREVVWHGQDEPKQADDGPISPSVCKSAVGLDADQRHNALSTHILSGSDISAD